MWRPAECFLLGMPAPRPRYVIRKIALMVAVFNSNIRSTNAFLSVTRQKCNDLLGYRAVLRVIGETKRIFGTTRTDAIITVKNLLDRISFRIANEERETAR